MFTTQSREKSFKRSIARGDVYLRWRSIALTPETKFRRIAFRRRMSIHKPEFQG